LLVPSWQSGSSQAYPASPFSSTEWIKSNSERREIAGRATIELAAYLKLRTLDAVLAYSDEELARDILMGAPVPRRTVCPAAGRRGGASSSVEANIEDFTQSERLAPHVAPGGPEVLASLLPQGWLIAPR